MYEASATKMWNEKLDYMSIANRPVLSSQGGSVNAQNIRWEPGAVYDAILQLVQQPPPPVDFDQEVNNNKSLAEQRVGIPDFGIGDATRRIREDCHRGQFYQHCDAAVQRFASQDFQGLHHYGL